MRPVLVVLSEPFVERFLELGDGVIHRLPKRCSVKLVEDSLVEPLADSIRLGSPSAGPRGCPENHVRARYATQMVEKKDIAVLQYRVATPRNDLIR